MLNTSIVLSHIYVQSLVDPRAPVLSLDLVPNFVFISDHH